MRALIIITFACAAVSVLVSCAVPSELKSDGGSDGGSSMLCAPNEQKACLCEDGGSGAQTCAQDGMSYSVCACQVAATACDEYIATVTSCFTVACAGRDECAPCESFKQSLDNPPAGDPSQEDCRKANESFDCDQIASAIASSCGGGSKDAGGGDGCRNAGETCPGGVCVQEVGGTIECYSECAYIGNACKGMDGGYTGACYLYGGAGQYACMFEGSKAVGESCGTVNDCVVGTQCLDAGGTMNCYQICTDTCDYGDCIDTELGFKVCVVGMAP